MQPFVRAALAWLITASALAADAAVVQWLYDVTVPVESQAERARAARTAMGELLIRVSGLPELPASPEVRAAIAEADKYYSRFEFATRPSPALDEPGTDDQPDQMVVQFHFEPAPVLALLRRAGLPVWRADRPAVLAWIAVDDGHTRMIVPASGGSPLATALESAVRQRARQRGLDIVLPQMDLEDQAVTAATILGRFWLPIEAASLRYAPDVILLGRVTFRADGAWLSDWDLRAADDLGSDLSGRAPDRSGTANSAGALGIDHVVDVLASRFAVDGRLGTFAVTIRGASTIAAYAAVFDYLGAQEYVEGLRLKTVSRDALTVQVHSRSGRAQLAELLSFDSELAPVSSGAYGGRADAEGRELVFAWRGQR